MHHVELTCTDGTSPETVAATSTLKIDGKEITGVRSLKVLWEQNALPTVLIEFHPGELVINTGADTSITITKASFSGDLIETKEPV
jgi:hypothetical protein